VSSVVVVGDIHTLIGRKHEVLELLRETQTRARVEPGCVSYAFAEIVADPGRYVVIQEWRHGGLNVSLCCASAEPCVTPDRTPMARRCATRGQSSATWAENLDRRGRRPAVSGPVRIAENGDELASLGVAQTRYECRQRVTARTRERREQPFPRLI
jgi:hypothetical protein